MNTFNKFWLISGISFLIYISIFGIVYIFKLNHLVLQSEDYLGSTALPFSLLYEGDFDLNEYYTELTAYYPQPDNASFTPYYLRKIGDNYYSIRPIWTSLLALPVYIPLRLMNLEVNIELIKIMSRIGGAFITALSCGFFYLILEKLLNNKRSRILLLIIYAFATNSLSTSSQGLWQHGSSQLLIAASIFTLLRKSYFLTGLLLGIATVSRPTNLLSFAIIGLYLLYTLYLRDKVTSKTIKQICLYTLGGLLAVILEILLNKFLYGIADSAAYGDQLNGWRNNIFEGFLGLWLSPSKGILPNSPILIFVLYGFYYVIKKLKNIKLDDTNTSLLYPAAVITLLHTFIMGWWYSWYGGYSWGYRMASDIMPFLVLMMIPFVINFYQKGKLRITSYILLTISILNHLAGFIFFDGVWHTIYDGKSRFWLWSIQNSEIIFDIKRVLYKVGVSKVNPIPPGY